MSATTATNKTTKRVKQAKSGLDSPQLNGVVMDGVIASPTAQTIHQQSRNSLTLMRQAVARPKQTPKIKSERKNSFKLANPLTPIKNFKLPTNPERTSRAEQITRHSKVNRFGRSAAALPKNGPKSGVPVASRISAKVTAIARPISQPRGVAMDGVSSAGGAMALASPMPGLNSVSHQKLEDMLDQALAQADAHKQMLQSQLKRSYWTRLSRPVKFLVGLAFVCLLLAGLTLAYLRVPKVSTRVAGFRAGINAQAPAYVPAGFSLASTGYKSGLVSLKFNSSEGAFTLAQQSSGLDDQSLRTNYVTAQSKLYQTSQYNGTTIYTYSPTGDTSLDATWVNNGIWYTIDNSAGLTSDQLVRIAQSL